MLQEVDLEDRFLRPISPENEALQLLTSHVRLIEDRQKPGDRRTAPRQWSIMCMISSRRPSARRVNAAEAASGRGVRPAAPERQLA
jgi:hypothetical protein